MRYLALGAILACAFSRYSYLLDPPWVFITLPLYILWEEVFDRIEP